MFSFHLFRHPLDGLSLLCESLRLAPSSEDEADDNLALVWAFPGEFLGSPAKLKKYPSLSKTVLGLRMGKDVAWGEMELKGVKGQKGRRAKQALSLLVASPQDLDLGLAGLLDRLRQKGFEDEEFPPTVHVVLPQHNPYPHLPHLTERDSVKIYWEIEDILSQPALDSVAELSDFLEEAGGTTMEFQLYSRWSTQKSDRANNVCDVLQLSQEASVRVCKEERWAIK